MKKLAVILLAVILLSLVFTPVLAASAGSILNEVRPYAAQDPGSTQLKTEADSLAYNIVVAVRSLAAVAAIIFLIWIVIIFIGSGHDAKALAGAKSQIIVFLAAIFILLKAEVLVGFIFSVFGYTQF